MQASLPFPSPDQRLAAHPNSQKPIDQGRLDSYPDKNIDASLAMYHTNDYFAHQFYPAH
jgi:hypothetical protein